MKKYLPVKQQLYSQSVIALTDDIKMKYFNLSLEGKYSVSAGTNIDHHYKTTQNKRINIDFLKVLCI